MRTVARTDPRGTPSAVWAWMKTSFQSRASWCDSSLGRYRYGPDPRATRSARVVEQVQPGVEQRRRHRHAIDQHMRLDQMPAARPDDEQRRPPPTR